MKDYCLNSAVTAQIKKDLKSGKINTSELVNMTSKERRALFTQYVPKAIASKINSDFESILILKNQKNAMLRWVKNLTGISKDTKKEMIDKVNRLTTTLSEEDKNKFLEDLVSYKLGVTVTQKEASTITELARLVEEKRIAMENAGRSKIGEAPTKEEVEYGIARVAFGRYMSELKIASEKKTISDYTEKFKEDPANSLKESVVDVAGLSKSVKAALDLSAIFRQGFKTMLTSPRIWIKNSGKSFDDAYKVVGGEDIMEVVDAQILSDPAYPLMRKAGLAIGVVEEAYPTSLPQKIPVLGSLFKASEEAFTAFQYRNRVDLFKKYLKIAENQGIDINNATELKAIGSLVNSLTGRGKLGAFEPSAKAINNVFFSPRLLKSHIDTLLLQPFSGETSFQRKQAGINLAKILGGSALILALADAFMPNSVEEDPRSSDFGKIKVRNTRFDVTGGMSSLATLSARLVTGESKSSTTQTITELNSEAFGSRTSMDVLVDFFTNKLSPLASTGIHVLEERTFEGDKPTVLSELKNVFVPLPISNYEELVNDPNSAPILFAMVADALGIGTNTYGIDVDWNKKDTKEMNQFKEKVGEVKFKEANKAFNKYYNDWILSANKNEEYSKLTNEEKKALLADKKVEIKERVFEEYNFKYTK